MTVEHVEVVYATAHADPQDAIASHGERLAEALDQQPGIRARTRSLEDALADPPAGDQRALIVQYNPYSYGRRGVAPRLPRAVHALRRRPNTSALAVIVHEAWIPIEGPRSAFIGLLQRTQLLAVCRSADVVIATTQTRAAQMQRLPATRRPVAHIGVGSNLPDRREERRAVRRELGATDSTLVIAQLGSVHETWLRDYASAAARNAAATGMPVTVLNLGATAPDLGPIDGARVVTPGVLSGERLASMLAGADIFLAPFRDGLTTRRTSVAAALQHGLPVVATDLPNSTDGVFLSARDAVSLTPVTDRTAFAEAAAALAVDPDRRQEMAVAARCLFDRHFAWSVIASRILEALTPARHSA